MYQDMTVLLYLLGNCNHRSLHSTDHNSNHCILTTRGLYPQQLSVRNTEPQSRRSPFLPGNNKAMVTSEQEITSSKLRV